MLTLDEIDDLWDSYMSRYEITRHIEAVACADRDKRIAELERELEESRRKSKPLSNYEWDEVG